MRCLIAAITVFSCCSVIVDGDEHTCQAEGSCDLGPSEERNSLVQLDARLRSFTDTSSTVTGVKEPAEDSDKAKTENKKGEGAKQKGHKAKPKNHQKSIPPLDKLAWLMWLGASVATAFALLMEFFLLEKCSPIDLKIKIPVPEEDREFRLQKIFSGVWPFVKAYLFEPGNVSPWCYMVVIIILEFNKCGLGMLMMVWSNEFWDQMHEQDRNGFGDMVKCLAYLICIEIFVGVYETYIIGMLSMHWRKWMTAKFTAMWLQHKAYYRIELGVNGSVDNPDQRIQSDIDGFIAHTIQYLTDFFGTMLQLLTRIPIVLIMAPSEIFGSFYCPGWVLYFSILQSSIALVVVHKIGKNLIGLHFVKQKAEADLRYSLIQVKDNAESIGLYNAEETEEKRIISRYMMVNRIWWEVIKYEKRMAMFKAGYGHALGPLRFCMLIPSYFSGDMTMGRMMTLNGIVAQLKGCFDFFVNIYDSLTGYRAILDRLISFVQACDIAHEASTVTQLSELPKEYPDAAFVARGINLKIPASRGAAAKAPVEKDIDDAVPVEVPKLTLWDNAGLVVRPGEFVLLSAKEGSGKSSFFRAVSGIWPDAHGEAFLPEGTLFVPQRSYIPEGSLKQAITYPASADSFTDDEVLAAIDLVKLQAVQNVPLDAVGKWSLTLSGGEQQRMALAHAVLLKPPMLFLDEATSALSPSSTLEVYRMLRSPGVLPEGAAILSIGHDLDLLTKVHDQHYIYDQKVKDWAPAPPELQARFIEPVT
eukprot:gnl/TRDRNA2_/TRDRNA2_42240_c0_seq1.p1 gnl/TRDRNA2_/TRDRNA2_42240_c0~~gnl/TRDRNA2_/TRDRNA2_42240_c0_seq1.p1  ORF type:complete len:756 (+),score=172.09 gnl/TRDRNA2_/TRDRNA2_42240_c0_seq1:97-2364(+)